LGRNAPISLLNHLGGFIREEVKSGKCNSVSEVIPSLLRLLECEERELIKAIEIIEQGGFVENFDPKQNLNELHRQHL
jgi:antitoxin ParD1/3/4